MKIIKQPSRSSNIQATRLFSDGEWLYDWLMDG